MQIKAKEKQLVVDLELGANLPAEVVSDPLRVRQVLINLLGNAIKFTPKGGVKLHLSSVLDGRTGKTALHFRVEDSGIGISPDQRENVFQMFVQADGSMTRRFGGTGLGLALSRRLARSLGGDVEIERSEEGVGTTFLFSLLDLPERAVGIPSANRKTKVTGEMANALHGKKVLVVDDAPDNQRLISIYLKKAGAVFEAAENGLEGYKRALAGEYDVILMDLQMPEMDGYTATQKLRDVGYLKPIIALTAHAMSEVREKCIQVGFTDHLPKPINPTELIGTIARYSR
jgi:CheY-like chemotaxis protein